MIFGFQQRAALDPDTLRLLEQMSGLSSAPQEPPQAAPAGMFGASALAQAPSETLMRQAFTGPSAAGAPPQADPAGYVPGNDAAPPMPRRSGRGGGGGWADALMLIGATMKDLGDPRSNSLQGVVQAKQQRQMRLAQMEALSRAFGLFGGAGQGAGVGRGGVDLRSPEAARAIAELQAAGVDTDAFVELLKARQPSWKIGPDGRPYDERSPDVGAMRFGNPQPLGDQLIDYNDPANINRVAAKAPVAGAIPATMDQQGNVLTWRLPGETAGAIAAASGAETAGRVGESFYTVPQDDGSTAFMRGRDYLSAGGGAPSAGGPGVAGAPRLGRSQSPADRIMAEGEARTATERAALAPKAAAALESQARTTDVVLDAIARAKAALLDPKTGQYSDTVAGLAGGATAWIPGTPARDFSAILDTIRANVGFDKLAEMRANSPTGGALGNVAQKENEMLQAVLGSIDQGQSPQQLYANLDRIERELTGAREARKRAYQEVYSPKPKARAGGASAGVRTSGAGFKIIAVD